MTDQGNTIPLNQPDLAYQWVAIYNDNTELKQNYLDPIDEHHFGHIHLDALREFYLEDSQGNRPYGIFLPEGKIIIGDLELKVKFPVDPDNPGDPDYRLIYFRRIRNDYTSGDLSGQTVKHVIGVQATVAGKNYQQLLFVSEDGKLELGQVK